MKKIELIEQLVKSIEKELPEFSRTGNDPAKIEIHHKDSEDEDPIKAPWIYMSDVAITVEDDGRYKVLDFHHEENPHYFDGPKDVVEYFTGYYDGFSFAGIADEKPTKHYAKGLLETLGGSLTILFENCLGKEIKVTVIEKNG